MSRAEPIRSEKAPDAYRTISEVSAELDVPQHVLRFWEGKFAQLRPVKRAGNRRYYRPEDIDLLRGIRKLLHGDGYSIRGVQKLLRDSGAREIAALGALTRSADAAARLDDEGPAADRPAMAQALRVVHDARAMSALAVDTPEAGVPDLTTAERRAALARVYADLARLKERLGSARAQLAGAGEHRPRLPFGF